MTWRWRPLSLIHLPPYPFKFHRYSEINMARSDTIFSKHDLVNKAIVLRVWVTSHPCLKLRSLLLFDMIYTIMAPIKLSLITAVRYTLLSLLSLSFPSFLLFQGQLEFNSSPPSAAYLRQWTGSSLVHVMASRLFGAKPLPEPMLTYCQSQWNLNRNSIIFIQENTIENVVCQNSAILSREKWGKNICFHSYCQK